MTGESVAQISARRPAVSRERVARFAAVVFLGALPVVTVVVLFATTVRDDRVAFDFIPFYGAAEAVLRGEDPYPAADDSLTAAAGPYVYPPVPALVTVLITPLSREAAGLLVMLLLFASVLATLATLGVRDWRCYGVALLWPPVLSAIQTGNPTLLLGLAAALSWRLRDRPLASGAAVGVTLATKFLMWPLVAWFVAARRYVAAGVACGVGMALLVLSWAAIGFVGLRGYPDLLRRLEDTVGLDSYTVYVVGLDAGLPSPAARAIWLGLGIGLLTAVVIVGRRGDERSSFILATAAALALSPLVWLHYFALLLVVVALARPRLGLLWFLPLAMIVTPGSGQPTPFETSATLIVAASAIALSLRESLGSAAARAEAT